VRNETPGRPGQVPQPLPQLEDPSLSRGGQPVTEQDAEKWVSASCRIATSHPSHRKSESLSVRVTVNPDTLCSAAPPAQQRSNRLPSGFTFRSPASGCAAPSRRGSESRRRHSRGHAPVSHAPKAPRELIQVRCRHNHVRDHVRDHVQECFGVAARRRQCGDPSAVARVRLMWHSSCLDGGRPHSASTCAMPTGGTTPHAPRGGEGQVQRGKRGGVTEAAAPFSRAALDGRGVS
jgi:hypothetical protein